MSHVQAAARHLVGRDEDLGTIAGFLDAFDELRGAIALRGEAGIGKTTLWLAGIDAALARGYCVLLSRPSEAETGYSFAGLADLLGAAADDVLPQLPPVQRRALETALLLGESQAEVDDRAVAAAFLGALRLLAADGPLCLAVDDLQWLDAASLAALRYALARLADEQVAALFAIRGDVPDWLRRTVAEDRLRTIDVHGLSLGALHELLRTRLDATFPRPTLIRLWETSGGNPFFALELARALQESRTLGPGEDLPIPSDLGELLAARLGRLGPVGLEAARIAAALAEPTAPLVESAMRGGSDEGLAETLTARILELDGERVRFTHPLLGSAVTSGLTPSRRRSLHARLAKVAPTEEERARHLALATGEPDGDVASTLDEAARTAHSRGAPAAAAELAEQALRLTPPTSRDGVRRRRLVAAELHRRAGDTGRATVLLEEARAAATPGSERAAVLAKLALIQANTQDAVELYSDALGEAADDDALQAEIHLRLAGLVGESAGIERGLEHGELAVHAAARSGDAALRCRALAAYGLMHFRAGRGIPRNEVEEALSLERSLGELPADGPTAILGIQLLWSAAVDRARELFQECRNASNARNDAGNEARALWLLALVEWRAGNWEAAERYAARSLDLVTQLGHLRPHDEFPAALIAAHRGRIDEARARAEGALARAGVEGIGIVEAFLGGVLGFVELSRGDAAAALPFLRRSYELRNVFTIEPGMRLELGDLLEALVAAGELAEAEEVLATWERRADELDRAWAQAILARGRGLVLAARGNLVGAFTSFEHALTEHARTTDPFQHARTLLALGRTERRAKRRGAARATLEDALARFEALGAPLWAEQARAELARIGGRSPSRGELTEGELRVATLVAEGRTNKEVASALFLAERTVASHLTHVYSKLGVRSRLELTLRLAEKSAAPGTE